MYTLNLTIPQIMIYYQKGGAMDDLKVTYRGYNQELDQALEEVLAGFGYACWASGYNHTDGTRDLAFEKVPSVKRPTEAGLDTLIEMVRES